MDLFTDIILYFILSIVEFFFEIKIASPITRKIQDSRFKKILFQEEDTFTLTILKSILLSILFVLPIIISILLLNKYT